MTNTNTISLIIPCYNCEKTIVNCIESAFKGRVVPQEIILVDDMSTDNTLQSLKKLKKKYKKIIIINTKVNSGPATARNVGAKKAKSNFLFFVDSDVELDKDTIKIFKENCAKYDAIVGIYKENPLNNNISSFYKCVFYFYLFNNKEVASYDQFSASCSGISTKVFFDLGGYDEWFKPGCDLENEEFGHRIVKNNYKMVLMPKIQVAHHFPHFFKMMKTFYFRTSLWMEMFLVRRKFSSTAGTSGMGLACVSLTASLFFLSLTFYSSLFIVVSFFLFAYFLKFNYPFYVYSFRYHKSRAIQFFFLSICSSNVISLGALTGFLKVFLGKSKLYKRFKVIRN